MKVLVVDDERDIELLFRQRFRRELRSGEVELTFAFSGEEALVHLSTTGADVVLSDVNMPGMNGLELLRRIKAAMPPVPVYLITAYGTEEYRRKAQAYGSDGYLTKPLDFTELKRQIAGLGAEN